MRTQSIDTSPEFERIQIAHLRSRSAAKKFTSVRSWTQSITFANLGSSDERQERSRAIAFVAREYGNPMASLFFHALEKQPAWRLQTPDIQEALLPLLDAAERLSIPVLLIGSVAGSIYGFPRSVHDVDLLTDCSCEQLTSLFEQLASTYVFDPRIITQAIHHHTAFSLLHVSRLIQLDLFLPSTVFEKTLVERRQEQSLVEGRAPLLIASAEDLTLLNLIHYQRQGSMADDRWNDILGILKVQAPEVDCTYLDRQAKGLGIDALFSQALIDAGIGDEEASSLQKVVV
jgi:hypothetical protein